VFTWWSLHSNGANDDALTELRKELATRRQLPAATCPENENESDSHDFANGNSQESDEPLQGVLQEGRNA